MPRAPLLKLQHKHNGVPQFKWSAKKNSPFSILNSPFAFFFLHFFLLSSMDMISITSKVFGNFQGRPVIEYTLLNDAGMEVSIIDYGATITRIMCPDREGNMGDVVLGFGSFSGYLQKSNPYFGATIGRYANRIANATFILEGNKYLLSANNNGHSLHGGRMGFDKVMWDVEQKEKGVVFSYLSPDGEEGFPGNLKVTTEFSLTENNELVIDYLASTDQATPVNLTNHSYFNLSAGRTSDILGHELWLGASHYTEVNEQLIPTGKILPVQGYLDFTKQKTIGRDITDGGYDHNYVLDKEGSELKLAAKVYDPITGRTLQLKTTQPGLQLYTTNSIEPLSDTKYGVTYPPHAALCLETQHFPDSPNQPTFPNTILRPGEEYRERSVWEWGVRSR